MLPRQRNLPLQQSRAAPVAKPVEKKLDSQKEADIRKLLDLVGTAEYAALDGESQQRIEEGCTRNEGGWCIAQGTIAPHS
jgi:hypothetical protein